MEGELLQLSVAANSVLAGVVGVQAIVIVALLVALRTAKLLHRSLSEQLDRLDGENQRLDAENESLSDEFETTGWNGRTRPRIMHFD